MEVKKFKKMICVTGDNNNKFYNMVDNGDGSWTAEWGRVGGSSQKKVYGNHEWSKKYNEKLNKGYKDISELVAEKKTVTFADITNPAISSFVNDLMRYAKGVVENTYLVTADAVTVKQVEEAQNILNDLLPFTNGLSHTMDTYEYTQKVNSLLLGLYTAIPRKMKNTRDHLISTRDGKMLSRLVEDEQSKLDAMAGQVSTYQAQQDNDDVSKTLLDAMGMSIFEVKPETSNYLKSKMGSSADKFRKAFRVINHKTQGKFDTHVANAKNNNTQLLFHGSRNENWWSILGTGLVLRPTNAVITGKMFGYGLYFANKAQKSIGYTSVTGSYWAKGSANKAYLAMYDVHTGNELKIQRHESWCYDLTYNNLQKRGNFDCLFALGGADLRNDELIVYREEQTTIKYLIEIA